MSDDWFEEQVAPDGVEEDGCHPDEARALQSYLKGEITTQECAHAITQPVLASNLAVCDLQGLWNFLQNALLDLREDHVQLVIDLLIAIEDLPDPDLTSRATGTTLDPLNDFFTWKGLPNFGHLWADVYKQDDRRTDLSITLSKPPGSTGRGPKTRRDHLRTAHVKRANIEARLAVANIGRIPLDWGYEAIADALEPNLMADLLDFELLAAQEWIDIAGEQLRKEAEEGKGTWALSRERNRALKKEGGRMTLKRWEFWVEQDKLLQEIASVIQKTAKAIERKMKILDGKMSRLEGSEFC
ncbi:MAG: hypothetical protein Q9220_006157 [cf. Caloplaca sp. 1 TL-2023]